MMVKTKASTLRNEDLIRQNYAMKDFMKQLTSVIKLHQIINKKQPADLLKEDTADSFFMKEQAMMSPDVYRDLLENADVYQSALRVKTYIDSYKAQPRFLEDGQKLEHKLRDMIAGKIKLPKFARDDIQAI